jgi:hypothetical protein
LNTVAFRTGDDRSVCLAQRQIAVAPNELDDSRQVLTTNIKRESPGLNVIQQHFETAVPKPIFDEIDDLGHDSSRNDERPPICREKAEELSVSMGRSIQGNEQR